MLDYYFPEEIFFQILTRLPVKSVIKFRCVSKSWYSLISSPEFINTQLNLNKKNNLLLFESTLPGFCSLNNEDTLDMDTSGFSSFSIHGCCNGLLCLSDISQRNIILWNPSIKKSVTLPTPNILRSNISIVGFGFDYRGNDYKVVRVQFMSNRDPPQVELCELSKRTWREITCTRPTYLVSSYTSKAYINGVVHWIAFDCSGVKGFHKIVAFDMTDEVFHEMALPDKFAYRALKGLYIGIFEESLMAVVYHHGTHPLNKCRCSVWVMKEYGVAKSWVNQFNFELGEGLRFVQSLMKNAELSLETTFKQLILDQQIKVVQFLSPSTSSLYVGTYMESLVLLNGRETNSCDVVTSKRKEDENEEQQAKTIKKTRLRMK